MKKLLGIVVLGLLWCSISIAEEIYISCTNGLVEDRSKKGVAHFGDDKRFSIEFFKFDNEKSEITIHTHHGAAPYYEKKPWKLGSIIIDYKNKSSIEFEIKKGKYFHHYKLNSPNLSEKKIATLIKFNFESTAYFKRAGRVFDIDYKSLFCGPPIKNNELLKPPKDKKLYQKWIKKGWSSK